MTSIPNGELCGARRIGGRRQTIDRGGSNPTTAVSRLGHFVRTTLSGDYAWGSKKIPHREINLSWTHSEVFVCLFVVSSI